MRRRILHIALAGAIASLCLKGLGAAAGASDAATTAASALDATAWADARIGSIDSGVFTMALSAANCAMRWGVTAAPTTLTVIDYSKPSTEKRLWVFDLASHALLYEELVAHGEGSGENLPTRFSNEPETHRSSIGLFLTAETYDGANGYSLRLDGLEEGFNDRARERAIVMHGAPYVDAGIARKQGRLGRSWGCPALNTMVAHEVIDRVKETGIVFAYYPDQNWLEQSRYLGTCAAPAAVPAAEPVAAPDAAPDAPPVAAAVAAAVTN